MFTRSSPAEPPLLEPTKRSSDATRNPQRQQLRERLAQAGSKSVIGNDLRIIGQGLKIVSLGTLQVDGQVEGDVGGAEVIIGEQGMVTGTVAAEQVIVRGRVSGVIRGRMVTMQSTARVEGDIHHMSLSIEQGAEFEGRCKRPADPSELLSSTSI